MFHRDTAVFENADIGRCSLPEVPDEESQDLYQTTTAVQPPINQPVTPRPLTTTQRPVTPVPPKECASQINPVVDPYMLTFGNEEGDSYGKINNLAKNHISVRFNISFEFRSFHQNGAIFLIGDPTDFGGDYVAGQLSDGIFMVYFKYDGTLYSVNSTAQTTNGQWHTVQVLKGTKNIRIQVDGNTKKEPIKRKLNIDAPVFVGGVKFDLSKRPELVQHSIRGCLRNFYINNQIILIKDAEIVKGVTKCYVNVEPGVYFPGSGYGIIDRAFRVDRALKINFEFRTSKVEGLILSISEGATGPALSIELYDGKIHFSILNKDQYSAVSGNTYGELCDKTWHAVTAEVAGDIIELIVDRYDPIYGISYAKDPDIDTSAPLFIGGLPSISMKPDTVLSSSNFEGCLRNVRINSNPIDFFSLAESYDIHKTDCPV